jgi:hypothetical protein
MIIMTYQYQGTEARGVDQQKRETKTFRILSLQWSDTHLFL